MSVYRVSLQEDAPLRLGVEDRAEAVLQAVRLVLSTPKGTVPLNREFGVDTDILDLPLPGAEQRARMEIREAVERWEPRARVTEISFSRDQTAEGKLIPIVEVEIVDE